jgi:hypothetical protein
MCLLFSYIRRMSHNACCFLCCSLKEEIAPGDMVLVDQYIDRTVHRPATFFEKGIVAHVGFGAAPPKSTVSPAQQPVCRMDMAIRRVSALALRMLCVVRRQATPCARCCA